MKQGIIASPRTFQKVAGGFQTLNGLSKEQMHHLLLYWDKIIIPTHGLVHFGVPDEGVLLESGLIERPSYRANEMHSDNYVEEFFEHQRSLSNNLSKDKHTNWSIHQFSENLHLDAESSMLSKIIQFDLRNALPVPCGDVSIYEVLEFKQRRNDELLQLNETLDELYQTIVADPDPDPAAANIIVKNKLEKAVQDLKKSSLEKFKSTVKFDISAQLQIKGDAIMKSAAAGAFIAQTVSPVEFPIGAILGGAASMVQITCKATKTFNSPASNLNLSYLSKATREKII